MTTKDIKNLTEQELKDLMYAICRSGRVVIPTFYRAEHVKNYLGCEPTANDMITIQDSFESDWSTLEYIDNAIEEVIHDIKP